MNRSKARPAVVCPGKARLGMAWYGSAFFLVDSKRMGEAWQGTFWSGSVGSGVVGWGGVGSGKVWHG